MINFAKKISSINKSLVGKGFDKCLMLIKNMHQEMIVHKVKSSTRVFDWVVPNEWVVNKAYFSDGKKKIL